MQFCGVFVRSLTLQPLLCEALPSERSSTVGAAESGPTAGVSGSDGSSLTLPAGRNLSHPVKTESVLNQGFFKRFVQS